MSGSRGNVRFVRVYFQFFLLVFVAFDVEVDVLAGKIVSVEAEFDTSMDGPDILIRHAKISTTQGIKMHIIIVTVQIRQMCFSD